MLSALGRVITAFAAASVVKGQASQIQANWNFQIPYQGAGVLTVCNNDSSALTLDSVAWNGNVLGVSTAWGELFPYNAEFSADTSNGITTLNASFPEPVSIGSNTCASGTYTYSQIDPSTYFPIVLAPRNVSISTGSGAPQDLPVAGQIANPTYPFPGKQLSYYQGDWYGYYTGCSWPSAVDDFNFHDRIIAFAGNNAQGGITYLDMDMLSKIIPQEQIKQLQLSGRDVYISEGGWTGSANFAAIFSDPAIRAQHNQNIVNICQQLNVNWDWDWEYPGVSDAPNFLAGIQDLASRLAAIGKKLSMTLPGGPARLDVLEQGYPGFFKALDAIQNLSKRLMSYDDGDGLWMSNMGSISPLNDTSSDGAGNSWTGIYNYLLSKGADIGANYEFGLPAYTRVLPVTQMGSTYGNGQPLDASRSPISQFPGQNDGTVDNLCIAKAMGDPAGICYDNPTFSLPNDMTYIPAGATPDLADAQTGLIYSNSSLYVGSIFDAQATAAHMKWALANGITRFFMWQRLSDAPAGSPLNIAETAAAILQNGTAPIPSVSASPAPSVSPIHSPSASASVSPSVSPNTSPSGSPSPSVSPNTSPSGSASGSPSVSPVASPSGSPSVSPSPIVSTSPGASTAASYAPAVPATEPNSSLGGVIAGACMVGAGLAAWAGTFYACMKSRRKPEVDLDYGLLNESYRSLNGDV
ncbi:MAG: chitinase [Gammaproteobacteria bacterium]|jgi:GH18 family chitinase|nr:chitinase [Gammaproteobacteria bacterium]